MENANLKNNIEYYMKVKGIERYSHLLIMIAHELGIKGEAAYEFANKEKGNFSKMLRGERGLKYDFIIPLEKIFGVSLARLLNEDAYKLPAEKENIPFDKGFRYYAYLDDPRLYKEEFDIWLTTNGHAVVAQTDEFGKSFLDYVLEYHSVHAVRYLYDTYGIQLKYNNCIEFKKSGGVIPVAPDKCIEFARLVASMNDVELFNNIFDSFYLFFLIGRYTNSIYEQSEYAEIILEHDGLFQSIFQEKPYPARKSEREDFVTLYSINPVINQCLRHALNHLDRYKHRAIAILKFGIEHNRAIAENGADNNYYICNELGGLKKFFDNNYYGLVVFADTSMNGEGDARIESLLKRLPKFSNGYV